MWHTYNRYHRRRENGTQEIFGEIVTKKIPKLISGIKPQSKKTLEKKRPDKYQRKTQIYHIQIAEKQRSGENIESNQRRLLKNKRTKIKIQ